MYTKKDWAARSRRYWVQSTGIGLNMYLDSQIGGQVLEMFRALAKKEDRALLIVTHDPKVRTISDRVLQIRDGLLAADGLAA